MPEETDSSQAQGSGFRTNRGSRNSRGRSQDHYVEITDRTQTLLEGVQHVDSFDDQEIVLQTNRGRLRIKGENLSIQELNLEQGRFSLEGLVTGFQYLDEESSSQQDEGGFIGRLFR